jgi:hypothetical protein
MRNEREIRGRPDVHNVEGVEETEFIATLRPSLHRDHLLVNV